MRINYSQLVLYPDNINGSSGSLIVRCMNLNPDELDTLLKLDLSCVPQNATVKSATLYLYYFHYNDGETVDMGAYEFDWIYVGDLDDDCDVDFLDFAVMAGHWLAGK